MRITGGQARGRLLASLKGLDIRPTSDRVREAIFDLIGHEMEGRIVLDLFAGTGSLGLEALSRGASTAFFADYSQKALTMIRKNIALCDFEHCSRVVKRDLTRGLPKAYPFLKKTFHLVFMDPPYSKGFIPMVLQNLSTSPSLAAQCLIVAESSKNEQPLSRVGPISMRDTRSYGDTRITIYSYEVKK
ncbi:MAG: 16S rRNA (guanine(966)-N(2))-methyltransferase RsmD [Desulfatiglandaceae bacterium]|jgi:16S rRNA (guanine966-N2)-methyltransferase